VKNSLSPMLRSKCVYKSVKKGKGGKYLHEWHLQGVVGHEVESDVR